jgi:hypothetical protein
MKKLAILLPVLAVFASCKSTTVVEAPKPTHTNTIVPVPVATSPTVTRESTTVHSTDYPVTRTRTSSTTVYP